MLTALYSSSLYANLATTKPTVIPFQFFPPIRYSHQFPRQGSGRGARGYRAKVSHTEPRIRGPVADPICRSYALLGSVRRHTRDSVSHGNSTGKIPPRHRHCINIRDVSSICDGRKTVAHTHVREIEKKQTNNRMGASQPRTPHVHHVHRVHVR